LLGKCIYFGAGPRIYNEALRQLEELSESLEVAVEDDGEEKA
jgi:hypothetical protein